MEALRAFPNEARKEAGYQLWRVQTEIRIHTEREHRIIYIAKFDEAVYVLHASEKRTRKTLQADLDLLASG